MISAITTALSTILGWAQSVVTSLIDATDGALYALLPAFAIGIGVSVLFLGVKVIRKIVWGA